MTYRLLICCVLPVLWSGGVADSQKKPPAEPSRVELDVAGALTADQSQRHPTAEQLLRELRQRRPITNLLSPVGGDDRRPDDEKRLLLPEGTPVVDRSGWLRRDGEWLTFAYDPSEGEEPVKLLPNATLEVMLHAARGASAPIQFVISGEASVWGDENYLLIRLARRLTPPREQATPDTEAPKEKDEASLRSARTPGPSTDTVFTPPSAEDVLAQMKQQQPELQVIKQPDLEDGLGMESGAASGTLMPDGSPFVRRPGRLIQQGSWWTFVFESDHPDHPEVPLRLLPNENLGLMIDAAVRGQSGLVFIVSGEVTRFEGRNYLLARAAMRRIDPGNLRK